MPAQFPNPTQRDEMPLPSLRLIQIMYKNGRIEMAARIASAGSIILPSNERSHDLPARLFVPVLLVPTASDGTRAPLRRLVDAPFRGTHRLLGALAARQHL